MLGHKDEEISVQKDINRELIRKLRQFTEITSSDFPKT